MDLPEDKLSKANNLLTRRLFKKAEQEADKSMKIKDLTNQENQELNQQIDEWNQGSRSEYLGRLRK